MNDEALKQLQATLDQMVIQLKNQDDRLRTLEHKQPAAEPKTSSQKKMWWQEPKKKGRAHKARTPLINWQNIELNLGKYFLQVIGAVVFTIGMFFFLKYSIEQEWISPVVRVFIGFGVAATLLGLGEYIRAKYRYWSYAAIGGGIAILYASWYASYNLYDLITWHQAFFGMAIITAASLMLGLRYASQTLVALSICGGFAAPIFLEEVHGILNLLQSARVENVEFVAVYIVLLALAGVFIACQKRWNTAGMITLLGSYFYWLVVDFERVLSYPHSLILLVAFWAIFTQISVIMHYLYDTTHNGFEVVSLLLSTAITFLTMPATLGYRPIWDALIFERLSFIFGIWYGLEAAFLLWKERMRTIAVTMATMAAGFIAGVFVLHFGGHELDIVLHVYALALFVLSFMSYHPFLRIFSYLVWLFSLGHFWEQTFYGLPVVADSLIFNSLNIATIVLVTTFLGAAYFADKYAKQLRPFEKNVADMLEVGAVIVGFIWFNTGLWRGMWYLIGLICYSTILWTIGAYSDRKHVRFAAGVIAAFAVFKIITVYAPFIGIRHVGRFATVCAVLMAAIAYKMFAIERYKKSLLREEYALMHSGLPVAFGVTAFILGRALVDYYTHAYYVDVPALHEGALTIYYGIAALIFLLVGLIKHKPLLRYVGFVIIALALWNLWFVIMGMSHTLNRVITFISVGIILATASFAYQRLSSWVKD